MNWQTQNTQTLSSEGDRPIAPGFSKPQTHGSRHSGQRLTALDFNYQWPHHLVIAALLGFQQEWGRSSGQQLVVPSSNVTALIQMPGSGIVCPSVVSVIAFGLKVLGSSTEAHAVLLSLGS